MSGGKYENPTAKKFVFKNGKGDSFERILPPGLTMKKWMLHYQKLRQRILAPVLMALARCGITAS